MNYQLSNPIKSKSMLIKFDSRNLIGLDLLRFLLSVTILIVHFPHFYYPFINLETLNRSTLPFASWLGLIYHFGGFAVEIFWMISGICFFHFYSTLIKEKKILFYQFLGLRFSRLYPLHILTLFIVAILQYYYHIRFGNTFIYQNNDGMHFILNILMINFWNAKFGLSFNGPFWSVSVEVFVYVIFFLFVYIGLFEKRKNTFLIVLIFFFFYSLGILSPFYECFLFFFTGGLLMQYFSSLNFKKIILMCCFISIFVLLLHYIPILKTQEKIDRIIQCVIKLSITVIIIVIFSMLFRNSNKKFRNILRELGNMTYAIYMVHIALQIILVLIFFKNGLNFFSSNTFFISYIVIAGILGFLTYRYFEMPIQNILRKLFHIDK